ncbi:hypothetical protein BBP40_003547 [Aspergillus hancockii]|nr:hypothetical protein BBP40_003547 [Aspergillus hancockii]
MAACAYQCVRLLRHRQKYYNHGAHVSRETLTQYEQSCLEIVKTVAQTSPSVQTTQRDLKGLIDEIQDHPESRLVHSQQQSPRQILSIHSLIARSDFVDDSEETALQDPHPESIPSSYEGSLATRNMVSGSNMANEMWLQDSNAFEGAWDEPGIDFNLIWLVQWDGTGYIV